MFLLPASVYISHIFTWFPPHPKVGEFLSQPPTSPGAVKGADGSCRDSGRRLSGNDLFLQLVKKYLQLFQVSFVCGREGRAPRGAGAPLCRGQSAAGAEAPCQRGGVGGSADPLQRGRNRVGAPIKRNENEHSKIFLLVFVLLFFVCFALLGVGLGR